MHSQPPFFGRTQELQLLDRLWRSTRPELLVLYGRPRVGKRRLLSEGISDASPRVLSWSAAMAPALSSPVPDPLRSFSQAVANFEQPGSSVSAGFTYAS